MATETTVRIVDERKPLTHWLRIVVLTTFYAFAPITVGILVDSSAMQWAGFILGFMILFAAVKSQDPEWKGLTVEQARRKLDELESAGRADV